MKIALIESKPTNNKYTEFKFPYDRYSLTSKDVKKVLKKDVDIDVDLDQYDWVILVGSEAFKYYTKNNSITQFAGKIVDDKFIPIINPAMLAFKPEAKKTWDECVTAVNKIANGEIEENKIPYENYRGINNTEEANKYIQEAINHPNPVVAVDTETSSLYPRDGYILGISISYKLHHGAYIDADCLDEISEQLLQELFNKKTVVFHNAKFDMQMLKFHFNFNLPNIDDTMLIHYMLDETPRTHGLKYLAVKHTIYGDYEKPLEEWKKEYCKNHGILKNDFSYDLIPFEVMWPYASIDAGVTLVLWASFKPALEKNKKLLKAYENIMIPGCKFLTEVQLNGVPLDKSRLEYGQKVINQRIEEATKELDSNEQVEKFREEFGEFNPNSVIQLRKLLFDYLELPPTGIKTGTGQHSTNAEVLGILAEQHSIPEQILKIRKSLKIKGTYLDNLLANLDSDSRLRTNFNQHMTSSGRLSSSGKLNMQQLPRDEYLVKGAIKARPGYKIVAMDLKTAEVYVAAVLSGDKNLMNVFKSGGDFHSTVAKKVYKLSCSVEEVKDLYPKLRQAAKAITFGIMYGAGPHKIASEVTSATGEYYSVEEAKEAINSYFKEFNKLKKWIDENSTFIENNGYVYSIFGRKRRLKNVKSKDRGVVGHEIRSGLNFLVQSTASDINLLGAIDAHENTRHLDSMIFALVHDSILAEVREDQVEEYLEILIREVQKDRGVSIPGCPIVCDIDVADDYSLGKFEEIYGKDYASNFTENLFSNI